jgi:hypothetical protein
VKRAQPYILGALVALIFFSASSSRAAISGSVEAEYTSHSVSDPTKATDETTACLSQKYSLYYTKSGVLYNSLIYSGFLGGEVIGLKKWLPKEETANHSDSMPTTGGLLGKDYQYRVLMTGKAEYYSSIRWLPLFARYTNSNDSLPYTEKSSLYKTFGSEPLLPVDFPTDITLPERTYQDLFLTLGFKNSPKKGERDFTGSRNPNLMISDDQDRKDEFGVKAPPLWDSLPYLQVAYGKTGTKIVRSLYQQDDTQSHLFASLGKDKVWANYRKIKYEMKSYTDSSWTEQLFQLGTIDERGFPNFISIDEHPLKFAPEIHYKIREGYDGYREFGGSLQTEGKIMYPTFYGWSEGELRTFLNYSNMFSDDGSRSVEYRVPVYFSYGSETMDERVRFEKRAYQRISMTNALDTNDYAYSWNANLNKNGDFLFSPSFNANISQNNETKSLSLAAAVSMTTTPRYSRHLNYSLGYELRFGDTPVDEYDNRLSGRVNYRFDGGSSVFLSQDISLFTEDENQLRHLSTSTNSYTTSVYSTSLGYSFVPSEKYSLTVTGTASFSNLRQLDQARTNDFSLQAYQLNLSSVYRTGNVVIDSNHRITSENQTSQFTGSTLSYESRTVASYHPIRSTEIAADGELHYYKNDGESRRITMRQRATYRYFGRLSREYWNLDERSEYSKKINSNSVGVSQSESKSVGMSLNLSPGTKVSANGRVSYADTSSGKTLSYGGGVNLNFSKLQVAFDWQEGKNNAGREEQKWAVSIKKSF